MWLRRTCVILVVTLLVTAAEETVTVTYDVIPSSESSGLTANCEVTSDDADICSVECTVQCQPSSNTCFIYATIEAPITPPGTPSPGPTRNHGKLNPHTK